MSDRVSVTHTQLMQLARFTTSYLCTWSERDAATLTFIGAGSSSARGCRTPAPGNPHPVTPTIPLPRNRVVHRAPRGCGSPATGTRGAVLLARSCRERGNPDDLVTRAHSSFYLLRVARDLQRQVDRMQRRHPVHPRPANPLPVRRRTGNRQPVHSTPGNLTGVEKPSSIPHPG